MGSVEMISTTRSLLNLEEITVTVPDKDYLRIPSGHAQDGDIHCAGPGKQCVGVRDVEADVGDGAYLLSLAVMDKNLNLERVSGEIEEFETFVDVEQGLGDCGGNQLFLGFLQAQKISIEPIRVLFRTADQPDVSDVHLYLRMRLNDDFNGLVPADYQPEAIGDLPQGEPVRD